MGVSSMTVPVSASRGTHMPRATKLERGISEYRGGYRVRISVDSHQYFIGLFDTLTDAKAALARAKYQRAAGTFVPPVEVRRRARAQAKDKQTEDLTVREWAQEWLTLPVQYGRHKGQPVTPSTVRTRRSSLTAHVLDAIGDLRMVDVKPEQIAAILGAIDTPSARRNAALALRAMFNTAVRRNAGGLTVSPFREEVGDHQRSDAVGRFEMITPATVRALTVEMPDRLALMVPLASWCDMRKGEILGLQRRDFTHLDDPTRATVTIDRQWLAKASPSRYGPPKAGSRRTVAIPASMVPTVVAHLDTFVGDDPESPVFPSPRIPTQPSAPNTVDIAWAKARKDLAPGLRFHDLRAVGLTEYARAGATTADLMARGGHKDVEVAMRYQRASAERDRALTDRLDAMIGGE